jgi:hypothetical protein
MTLGNMRQLGVQHLVAYCHNDACRHQAPTDVSSDPDDVEVLVQRSDQMREMRGRWVDVHRV